MKVFLGVPGELEHPPVSLIVYCNNLVQAENLTVGVHCYFMNINVFFVNVFHGIFLIFYFVQNISLISVLSISTGFSVQKMVDFGM